MDFEHYFFFALLLYTSRASETNVELTNVSIPVEKNVESVDTVFEFMSNKTTLQANNKRNTSDKRTGASETEKSPKALEITNHTAMCITLAKRYPIINIRSCVLKLNQTYGNSFPTVPEGMVSVQDYQQAKRVLILYMLPTLAAAGLVGNAVVVALLLTRHLRGASSGYVAGLVLAHSLQLLTCLLVWVGVAMARQYPTQGQRLQAKLFPYNNIYLTVVCTRLVAVLSVVVGVERLLILRFPTRAKTMALQKYYIPIIGACALGTAIFFVPNLFRYKALKQYSNSTHSTRYAVVATSYYTNHERFFQDHQLAAEIIFEYILWLASLALVLTIIQGIRKAVHQRKTAGSLAARVLWLTPAQQQTTQVLLIVLGVHLACTAPAVVAALANRFNKDFSATGKQHFLYLLVKQLNVVLAALQGCVNLPLLLALSRNFRRAVRQVCCCNDPRRRRTLSAAHFLPTSPSADGVNFGFSLERLGASSQSSENPASAMPVLARQDSKDENRKERKGKLFRGRRRSRAYSTPASREESMRIKPRSFTFSDTDEEERGL